ncbi:hypothetical protein KVT40_005037 [Elsinoe batatas]|uniref:DNA mismatch repair protein MutL n=1 Tax=Elsinoe batatas TaxID=2601811 RepID=A0A8K0PJB0_9PEZI|nr:hypothetical protein KVT40_005037 [Elsinoe batatas]
MASIKAIAASSVHQIQSGQVIVDLTSVVKELIENALDAGATSIDVRFKNSGLDSIEVQDNGSGIATEDFGTVGCLKTYGFRGEALSSLCALSDFHVITATAGPKGSRLEFDVSGKLKGTSVVAAVKGTTISVEKLFKNLPVRRRELEKNVKREYGKVLNFLQAYACISVNVRFSVSNTPAKGKKTIVFSTKSNPTTKENIVNVYGAKTLLALVSMDLDLEMQPSFRPPGGSAKKGAPQVDSASRKMKIQGHISKPIFGEGRQAPDRQMFFVNSRPCQLPQVSKAFNEVYKSFNVSQSPFIFANLIMDTNSYDVNVSPDKRSILLHDQTALLESLKESLTTLFEQQDQTMPASQLQAKKLPGFKQPTLFRSDTSRSSISEPDPQADSRPKFADSTPEDRTQLQPGQLISGWVGRDAQSRAGTQDAIADAIKEKKKSEFQKALAKSVGNGNDDAPVGTYVQDESLPEDATGEAKEANAEGDEGLSQLTPPPPVPREVQDFNARILSQKTKQSRPPQRITTETMELDDGQSEDQSPTSSIDRSDSEDTPAIRPGQHRVPPGPVQNAFDRMRPKRPNPEIATVTVGDRTLTMTLEGPESKRRRMHTPKMTGKTKEIPQSSGFTSGLKMFAAAGSQMAGEARAHFGAEDEAEEVENDDVEDEEDDASKDEDEDEDESGHGPGESGEDEPSPMTEEDDLANGLASSTNSAHNHDSLVTGLFVEADDSDDEYLDEDDKKAREDAKVARMIQEAEEAAAKPGEEALRRASQALRSNSRRKDAPLQLQQTLSLSLADLEAGELGHYTRHASLRRQDSTPGTKADDIGSANAEAKLSLTISKPDFAEMRIAGQFNLGFILAIRPAKTPDDQDHLFIIDQHAADEKFNFERLYASTNLTPQRLVTPKDLQLSAVEEELISANSASLLANGFEFDVVEPNDDAEDLSDPFNNTTSKRRQFRLLTLPTSKETTFSISDLEELLHLLSESAGTAPPPSLPSSLSTPSSLTSSSSTTQTPSLTHRSSLPLSLQSGTIVRPSRVRKMLAMRACRSSIMVGKNLTQAQMGKVVRHMGEMERPWNCPHGRPTMRHLAGLGEWEGWSGDAVGEGGVDWGGYAAGR